MPHLLSRLILPLAALAALGGPVLADPAIFTPAPFDETFSGFAGRASQRLSPFAGFEDNYVIGAAYQRFFLGAPESLRFGLEVGFAGRFGAVNSLEAWAGIVGRADFEVLEVLRISPALTVGLSAVTAPLAGGEETRQNQNVGGDATLLFYLGPEVSFSLVEHPETELFLRLHHRSGAWGTLGNMHSGLDVYALGVRHQF